MKLVTRQTFDETAAREIVPDLHIVHVDDDTRLLEEAADAEIVVGIGPGVFEELVRIGTNLRWVHTSVAGADRFIGPALASGKVVLTCAKGGPAGRNLAEHAIGLALALSRNIGAAARASTWRRRELSDIPFELTGKTAGIAGFGATGRDLADLLSGFHIRVIATKRSGPHSVSEFLRILPASGLDELLAESDLVFDFLPATEQTHRIFDRHAFAAMKPTALFINVGRGSTVDTEALVGALESGTIAGAGIDAVDPEPLPGDHPLWSMPNVVITPHIAGVSPNRAERNTRLFLENLRRYRDGTPLESVVDYDAGY
jgi:phosphoglycerate dehydrogenase-like enzyme